MNLRRLTLAAVAAFALTAAACSDDDDGGAVATESTEAAPVETTTSTTVEDVVTAPIELTSSDLGEILTSDGRTLYAFVPDAGGGTATCTGGCADNWPGLMAGDVSVGAGLDASLFTTDGDHVAIDGWPLYFFAGDAGAGDTNGQGVGDNWYVVGADGAMIQ